MEDWPFVAIACYVIVKCAAYAAAGRVLAWFYGTQSVPPALFGVARMFAGLVVGTIVILVWHPPLSVRVPSWYGRVPSWYGQLAIVRLVVWAACVTLFFGLRDPWKVGVASLGGTLLSYLSDIPIAFVALPLVIRTSC